MSEAEEVRWHLRDDLIARIAESFADFHLHNNRVWNTLTNGLRPRQSEWTRQIANEMRNEPIQWSLKASIMVNHLFPSLL